METMSARLSLACAAACFVVGSLTLAVWSDSDTAQAVSVALLVGMWLFLVVAVVDIVRRRR